MTLPWRSPASLLKAVSKIHGAWCNVLRGRTSRAEREQRPDLVTVIDALERAKKEG